MSEKGATHTYQSHPDYEQDVFILPKKKNRLRASLFFASKLVTVALALYGLYFLSHQTFSRLHSAPKPVICNCGSSIAEAEAKGCKYDSLATAWLPPACRDDELTSEFEHSGPLDGAWPYFKDLRKAHPIGVDDLGGLAEGKGDARTFYTTTQWYVARCLFYWRKMERAERLGTTIEKSFLDASIHGHNISNWHHCANVYLKGTPRDQIATAGHVGFGDPVA